jgi:sugar/nucleoside kinase (ribokinase family)
VRVMSIGTVMVDVLAVGLPGIAEPGAVVYTPREIETRIGGHPIDVAIDLVRLGADPGAVCLVAALGTGPYGRIVRSVIEEHGFVTFLQEESDRDTGKNIVLQVGDEDRRFHIDPGANWVLDPVHVTKAIDAWSPAVVTIRPGYSGIDLSLGRVLGALDADAVVLLDIMQPHPSRPSGYLDEALGRADIVHCNEIEARVATGAATVEEAVARFLSSGVSLVLITAGGNGATAYTPTHRIRQPGFQVEVVDVTGCGDAFCAGAVFDLVTAGDAGTVDGHDPDRVARLLLGAQAAGASAATAVGCVEGVAGALVDRVVAEQAAALLDGTRIERHSLV